LHLFYDLPQHNHVSSQLQDSPRKQAKTEVLEPLVSPLLDPAPLVPLVPLVMAPLLPPPLDLAPLVPLVPARRMPTTLAELLRTVGNTAD
jgi:hypothetical protein